MSKQAKPANFQPDAANGQSILTNVPGNPCKMARGANTERNRSIRHRLHIPSDVATKMSTAASDPITATTRPDGLHRGLRLTLILSFAGLLLGLSLLQIEASFFRDNFGFLSLAMFRGQDTVWLGLSLAVGMAFYWYPAQPGADGIVSRVAALWPAHVSPRIIVGSLTLVVLIFVGAGTYLIHHAYGLVSDEVMGELQADIFLSGRLLADFPEQWVEYRRALFSSFLMYDSEHQLMGSSYRPGYAAIRALFDLASLGHLANAAMTALSIYLVASIARKLWPDRGDAAVLAAVLLATCPQVLFTGMTGFAWSAHLCLNLLWLRLFLRDDRLGHGLAALVGFAAIGLHQINPHPFFVLPFMLSLLFARRWPLAFFYASSYSLALAIWIFWPDIAIYLSADDAAMAMPIDQPGGTAAGVGYLAGALNLIGFNQVLGLPYMATNLLRLVAWQNLAILPLIFVALRRWSGAPQIVRLLAWSCALSMIPYLLIMPNQMYGWGYRYAHGLLGNLALIAAFGWISISAHGDQVRARAKQIVVGFTALVVIVGLPLRSVQVERFVGPYAEANRYLHELPGDLVLIDASRIWIWPGVIRNDPFFADRPLVLAMQQLTNDQVRRLCDRYTITFVTDDDLAPLGLPGANPPRPNLASGELSDTAQMPASEHNCPAS